MSLSPCGVSPPGSVSPSQVLISSCIPLNSRSAPAHGTALSAPPAAPGAMGPACGIQARQGSASSPSAPSVLPSVPSPGSGKPQKLKSNKSLKPKESPVNSTNCDDVGISGSSGKKRKNSSPPFTPSSSSSSPHSTDSFRKNCVVNSGHSGTVCPSPVTSSYSIGLNCLTNKANSVGMRHSQSGRGLLTGSPSESIKRMSVMVNSGDATLSLGPFVHQSNELMMAANSHSHAPLDKLLGRKRKGSPGSSAIHHSSQSSKVAKLPPMNSVHTKHPGPMPGTQGLANNSLLPQVREDRR